MQHHHLLPDAVGRQNPWVLFRLLDGLEGGAEEYTDEHLRMFYGEEV